MSGQPSPKRQRTSDKPTEQDQNELELVQKVIDAVGAVEEELEKENEKQAKEILAIESKYNIAKRPLFEKRGKLLKDIPHFWKQTLLNTMLSHMVRDSDVAILEHLENVDVTFVDKSGGYKVELTFSENAYFSDKSLWKQIKFTEGGDVDIESSGIKWKSTDVAKEASSEEASVIKSFASTEDGSDDLAELIKEEIWKNPVQFFLNLDGSDDEGEEGEDDDEDEGDEDEE